MKASPATVLILIAALVAGGWGFWAHRERGRLAGEVRELREERDRLRRTAEQKVSLAAGTELDRSGPRGLLPDGAPKENGEPDGADAGAKGAVKMAENFADMMKDPKTRDAILSQMKAQIDFQYRDLFDLLDLDAEKQSALSRVLANRQERLMDFGFAQMGSSADPEKAAAAAADMEAVREETEAKLKELLGPEGFDQLDRFEKSQPERQQLQSFRSQLDGEGLSLDESVETQLMDAMYEERTGFAWENDLHDQTRTDPERFRPEAAARFLEQNRELQQKVIARAAAILTPQQLEVFRKVQEQQNALAEMGVKMATQMFQQSGEANAPPAEARP